MIFFDTHAHLNFKDYDKDRKKVLKKSLKEGVFMINVGTDLTESKKVIEIAKSYSKGVYSAVGLHPLYIEDEDFKETFSEYEKLAKEEKVVAIGETGLDYKKENKEKQKEVFIKHLELATKHNLPLILHSRKAHSDLIEILKENQKFLRGGVIHCFTGNKTQAKEYLNLGFYLGINGIIFKMNLEKIIKETPLERILLETDCPFLTPFPEKGRNEPIFVKHVGKEVARIKNLSDREVAQVTTENAKKLFKV